MTIRQLREKLENSGVYKVCEIDEINNKIILEHKAKAINRGKFEWKIIDALKYDIDQQLIFSSNDNKIYSA